MQRRLPNRFNAEGKRATEYIVWQHAKDRYNNPNHVAYDRYGGRGIKMCDQWINSFDAFFAYLGLRPKGTVLDRIDNDKGYEPGNVRWADHKTSGRNRSNVRFSIAQHGKLFYELYKSGVSQAKIAKMYCTGQPLVGRYIKEYLKLERS